MVLELEHNYNVCDFKEKRVITMAEAVRETFCTNYIEDPDFKVKYSNGLKKKCCATCSNMKKQMVVCD